MSPASGFVTEVIAFLTDREIFYSEQMQFQEIFSQLPAGVYAGEYRSKFIPSGQGIVESRKTVFNRKSAMNDMRSLIREIMAFNAIAPETVVTLTGMRTNPIFQDSYQFIFLVAHFIAAFLEYKTV